MRGWLLSCGVTFAAMELTSTQWNGVTASVGLAPGPHESAGPRTPVVVRHDNEWLTSMLVEGACSVAAGATTTSPPSTPGSNGKSDPRGRSDTERPTGQLRARLFNGLDQPREHDADWRPRTIFGREGAPRQRKPGNGRRRQPRVVTAVRQR
jgi:hypothetical protein